MARERRSATEEPASVPGQRRQAPPPDASRDTDVPEDTGVPEKTGAPEDTGAKEGTGAPEKASAPEETSGAAEDTARDHPQDLKIRHTRISATWVAVVGFAIVLLLLLIFILQNQNTVQVSYLGAHGSLPLGVSLLLAAVAGILLVALAGSARILQLRATARKHRRADAKAAKAAKTRQ
ncbi:MAG: DUF1049 domain-containing protein [Nocardiopsaceae bacterium]|nr:DUF1049 domain-containing protein [Nocardiopsaceae bacterium]